MPQPGEDKKKVLFVAAHWQIQRLPERAEGYRIDLAGL